MINIKLIINIFLASTLVFSVATCKKKSSSSATTTTVADAGTYPTTVAAITLNSKVSVVDAKASTTNAKVNFQVAGQHIQSAINVATFGATTDYAKATTDVFVNEQSAQALKQVNSILCYVGQTKYTDLTNKDIGFGRGIYRAQVNDTKCESKGGSGGKSKGGGKVTYSDWVVESTRADSASPQIVKFWVSDDPSAEGAQSIEGHITLTSGATDANIYGVFVLDFVGYGYKPDGTVDTATATMRGQISSEEVTGGAKLTYYQWMNGQVFGSPSDLVEAVILNWTPTGGSGSSTAVDWGPAGPTTVTFDFAFNDTHFYRQKGTSAVCLDRSAFNEMVWSYGMFDKNGAAVDLTSGFPIKFTSGTKVAHGYIGNYGIWTEGGATLASGDTVTKEEWDTNVAEVNYTVFTAGGKLEKNTKKEVTLADVKNIPLSWGQFDTATGSFTDYRVVWNGTNMVKEAQRNQSTNWVWADLTTATAIDLSAEFGFFFYSQALGGSGMVELRSATTGAYVAPTATTKVIFHTRSVVYPGDTTVPTTLQCFGNECPDPSSFSSGTGYFTEVTGAATHVYTWDATNNVLKTSGGTAVLATTGSNSFWSGSLVSPADVTAGKLNCPYDATQLCPFMAFQNLTTFYSWNTGPNDWEKFTALKSADGTFLKFDEPLSVKVAYSGANAKYVGSTFYLEYGGYGDLWGLPTKCVDSSTGLDAPCGDSVFWIPEVALKNGTLGTDAVSGAEYVIKALDMEQKMKKVAAATCTNAGLTLTTETLPDGSSLVDPNLGTAPAITGPATVIGGVIKATL